MSNVNITTAIKYGFVVVAYFVGILVLGGIVAAIGFALVGVGGSGFGDAGGGIGAAGGVLALVGIVVGILGYVIVIGAAFGIQYKIISDGVARGIETAGGLTGGGTTEIDERT